MNTGSRIERQKYKKQQANYSWKKTIKKVIIFLIMAFFILIIAGAGIFGYYAAKAPTLTQQDLLGQVASKIYDKDQQLIKELGSQNRDLMTKEEIPDLLKQAVLAVEDNRFYDHSGVDPIRIAGAFIANLKSGSIAQGGSTITQQLVKLSVFSTDFKDQTLERKSQEAWLSLQLEQKYSKDDILTYYLNKLFYSNNTYGAKTAAKTFFNKELNELSVADAALLAGIPQAPSQYDPYNYPQAAQERRDLILSILKNKQVITAQEYDEAINTSIASQLVDLKESAMSERDKIIDAYLEKVSQEVQEKTQLNIFTDGVEVYTNLDLDAQTHLYETVNNNTHIAFPNDEIQTAAAVVDVQSGELRAIIGGRKQDVYLGLNRATTNNRSVASTIKPLIDYGPAIEFLNYSTGQLIVDEPYTYTSGETLENYDYTHQGNMTLREALVGSRNIPALKLLKEVGLDNAYAFLQKMDIQVVNDNQKELVEANAIGGEISPVQLAAAYATLSNYGQYNEPLTVKKIITSAGTEHIIEPVSRQAMKDSTAYMITDILKGVPGQFAPEADIPELIQAGKTGTTNYTPEQLERLGVADGSFAAPDGWYAGYTPTYAMVSWVGYDDPFAPGHYLTLEDARLTQVIYKEMMTYLMKNHASSDWRRPNSVEEATIEKYTSPLQLPSAGTPQELRSQELFVKGTVPQEVSKQFERLADPIHFDANYDETQQSIVAEWAGSLPTGGYYELFLNGDLYYTGPQTAIAIPISTDGTYDLSLRISNGTQSSNTLIITLSIRFIDEEATNESSSSEESDSSSNNEEENPPSDQKESQEHTLPRDEEKESTHNND